MRPSWLSMANDLDRPLLLDSLSFLEHSTGQGSAAVHQVPHGQAVWHRLAWAADDLAYCRLGSRPSRVSRMADLLGSSIWPS